MNINNNKCRGKRIKDGEWIKGSCIMTYGDGVFISDGELHSNNGLNWRVSATEVDRDTIGFWTGLLDDEDKEIFEGDVIDFTFFTYHQYEVEETKTGEISSSGLSFSFMEYGDKEVFHHELTDLNFDPRSDIRVTGNIYDQLNKTAL